MLPGIAYLLINNYAPMAGLFIAFKNIDFAKGFIGSDWIGFKNFEYLFATSDALLITRNTVLYNVAFIVLNLVIPVILALLLNEIRSKRAFRFYQSVIIIPTLISWVIVSYLGYAFLSMDSGFINKSILPLLGVPGGIAWYNEARHWPYILVIANCWKNAGFYTVIYYAAVIGLDKELFEAARIDGASKTQQIRAITLPLIMPVIIMMLLFGVGKIFYSDFGLFYQVPLDSGALYDATNVIDTYVYHGLMQLGDIGMASAAGLYQSLVGFILILAANLAIRKVKPESALF